MEFELGTTLIGFSALAFMALPFILDHRSRTKREKLLVGALRKLAHQHQCTVEEHETCGDIALGIDRTKNAVLYFSKHTTAAHFVDLATMRSCHANKAARIERGGSGVETMERVELCFVPKEKGRDDIRLELYREGTTTGLNGELQFVDKWAALVNDRLKRKH